MVFVDGTSLSVWLQISIRGIVQFCLFRNSYPFVSSHVCLLSFKAAWPAGHLCSQQPSVNITLSFISRSWVRQKLVPRAAPAITGTAMMYDVGTCSALLSHWHEASKLHGISSVPQVLWSSAGWSPRLFPWPSHLAFSGRRYSERLGTKVVIKS